jgi:hypothetical protein
MPELPPLSSLPQLQCGQKMSKDEDVKMLP